MSKSRQFIKAHSATIFYAIVGAAIGAGGLYRYGCTPCHSYMAIILTLAGVSRGLYIDFTHAR